MEKFRVLFVIGPTAVGKTDFSINLAKKINAEVISADSRQFYKEMNIGTAKPSTKQLTEILHHFINSLSIFDNYSVSEFEKQAILKINNIHSKGKKAIVCGGTGFYTDVLLKGIDMIPAVNPLIREELQDKLKNKGIIVLLSELEKLDHDYYDKVDKANHRRILRALEVCKSTGIPYSSYLKKNKPDRPFTAIKLGLNCNREILYNRIEERCRLMLQNGLIDEVLSLTKYKDLPALKTIGYTEFFDYFDGKMSLEQAINKFIQHSRNYAKRQLTWWRKDPDIHWFDISDVKEAMNFALNLV